MKKILALLLALAMMFALVACGGTTTEEPSKPDSSVAEESKEDSSAADEGEDEGEAAPAGRFDALQTTDENLSLLLYWHNLQPTINEEPTEEAPTVRNACRIITNEWLSDKPNVTIDWCQIPEMTEEWVTVNYTAGNGPDTLFFWGGKQWVENGMALVLEELADCIPSPVTVEDTFNAKELAETIRSFLDTIPVREQDIFLRRYFFVEESETIASRYGMKPAAVLRSLSRTRAKLKQYLIKEGYGV